ncbi:hypothetical protein [Halogranum gelatinilyticum]|uniref:hypothetical protein n=1 Tax=Halogranum gelatinilyticum TaxID=660521 RepID=UPI000B7CD627|nr:hypothetical protein [Halogranum gelatinilyticum]
MYEAPAPSHGFLPVTLAFLGYVGLSFGLTAGLVWLGVPNEARVPLFLVVALCLLLPAVRVFRRLVPRTPGSD